MLRIFVSIIIAAFFSSCSLISKPNASPEYIKQVDTWHQGRIESLTSETGWLTLAGLFWLKEGDNTFGSDKSNDIDFPQGKAPPKIGYLNLNNNIVTANIGPEIRVTHADSQISQIVMKNDSQDGPTILEYQTLSWYIIKRGERLGVRLKDRTAPTRTNFKGIERFPVDSTWSIIAKYLPYDSPKNVTVPTAAGLTEELSPGLLEFEINSQSFQLEPLGDKDSKNFFIIFGDKTSGKETYGGGRFLYVENPGDERETVIDFNKAYNPPCVFTPYATCPLPPDQNRLPIKITAGEKVCGNH